MGSAVQASLLGYWRQAQPYQVLAYAVGTLLMVVGLAHGLGYLLFGGDWVGPVAWRKPFAFGLSFGITTVTLSWVATYVPMSRRMGWRLFGALAAANTYEVAWVSLQRARGVASHFAFGSVVDAGLFFAGGFSVLVTIAVILTLTVMAFTQLQAPASMAVALRAGLLTLIAAQVAGGFMIANGFAAFEAGDPQLTTYGAAGIMKVPHAVSMHGIQVLPGLAWLLSFTRLGEDRRVQLVALASGGYAGLVAVNFLQTFRGLAPWDLGAQTASLLLASLGALGFAFLAAAGALRRGASQTGVATS